MDLQIAIDRMTLKDTISLLEVVQEADIIELGTSLCKDYGIESVHTVKKNLTEGKLLVDIKTIDEGEYEFTQYYKAGADSLTVMGASSKETLDKCYEVSKKFGKEMVIDLLECSKSKISLIKDYPEALYCLHFSSDSKKKYSIKEVVSEFQKDFPSIKRLAIAGGINLSRLKELENTTIERAIVGSYVTNSESAKEKIKEMKEVINQWK